MVGSTRTNSSSPSMARTRAGSPVPSTRTRVRSRSTSSVVGATPRSACSSRVSTSSQSCSEIESLDSRASRPLPRTLWLRARRARRRTRRPAVGAGTSSPGAVGPAGTVGAGGARVPVPASQGGCRRGRHLRRGASAAADEGDTAHDHDQEHSKGDQDVGKCVLHGSRLTVGDDGSGWPPDRPPLSQSVRVPVPTCASTGTRRTRYLTFQVRVQVGDGPYVGPALDLGVARCSW